MEIKAEPEGEKAPDMLLPWWWSLHGRTGCMSGDEIGVKIGVRDGDVIGEYMCCEAGMWEYGRLCPCGMSIAGVPGRVGGDSFKMGMSNGWGDVGRLVG